MKPSKPGLKSEPVRDETGGPAIQVLDADGRITDPERVPALSDEELRRLYRLMVLTRAADQKAVSLQRQGRLGTYPSSLGHEACQVGTAFAARKEDWLFPYFRDMGLYLTAGYPLADFLHYWMGNEAGLRTPDGLNLFPLAIPVASQILHAVGASLAARLRRLPLGVLVTFGDGATSEGDFHEAMNFAGVFKTPVVFVCYNNQWAISTPRSRQTASATLAQKAAAYGFQGLVVDGNDVLAVLSVVGAALQKARAGLGPTMIEAVTYRLGDHTTSDDAAHYRQTAEVQEWRKKDPLPRFREYLRARGLWDEPLEKSIADQAARDIERAVAEAEARPPASADDLFRYAYKDMPERLKEQLADMKSESGEGGR